jgi:hypothetical protein
MIYLGVDGIKDGDFVYSKDMTVKIEGRYYAGKKFSVTGSIQAGTFGAG